SATTSYSVTVTDGMTSDTDAVEVTVNALPTANAGLDVTIDEGNSITLTASGGGTYLWNTGATSSSITVSPTTNTTYSVTVSQNGCSSVLDDVTVTVNSVGCSYSVLNSEGFESGWGIWNDGGVDSRRSANDANYASTGIYCVRLRDDNSTSTMTTDDLDLTSYEEITINFGYYARSMDNSNEDFWLQISNTGGASFTIIEEWNLNDEFVNNQFYTDQVIIPGPFNSNTQFRFRADGSGNSDWIYIDDVVISGCSNGGAARIVANKKEVLATIEPDFGADAVSTSLYPNPFNSEMTLKIEGNYEKADVRIFNVLGQSLYFKSFNNKEIIQISTDNFQNGQYLIRMDIDGITTYKRAIKD
ncbi:T9SS type A sorting domain-containing protein, partial [Algibacter sp.]|nr:T9SS type A sorting domain-containing protein [Algibacter sp.]